MSHSFNASRDAKSTIRTEPTIVSEASQQMLRLSGDLRLARSLLRAHDVDVMDEDDPGSRLRLDEPIDGWRVWNLSEGAAGPRLLPAGSGVDSWEPRRATEARCGAPRLLTAGLGKHTAPDIRCRCGIYASRSLDVFERPRPAWPPAPVVGTVSLWGTVVEHERGWRGRFAYPSRLRLVCAMCAWFEPGTGIPQVVHAFGSRLYTLCAFHRGGIQVPDGRRTHPTGLDPRKLQARLIETYAVDLLPQESVRPLFQQPSTLARPYLPSISVVPIAEEGGTQSTGTGRGRSALEAFLRRPRGPGHDQGQ
jgi:hypothetical protein